MSTENNAACPHCCMHHVGRCPAVQAIEYYPDGTIKRVEYIKPTPADSKIFSGFTVDFGTLK